MNKKNCLFTNDVETTSILLNKLSDKTGFKVYQEGMPILLDLYQKYNIKSTFFFTGYISKLIPDIVKMIINDGHEVGSHGLSHKVEHGFDVLSYKEQCEHLKLSKDILENITGEEVLSFRAPALRTNINTPKALLETGFKIDSSVSSQRFDFFLSFGSKEKLKNLIAPRLPYKSSINTLYKKGKNGILEIPISSLLIPYIGTTLRIFPFLTDIIKQILYFENIINSKPIVFLTHPNEFINEKNIDRKFGRRSSNIFNYYIKEVLRTKLKLKNLGKEAIPLYENQINFFNKKGFQFSTLKDYCIKNNLL